MDEARTLVEQLARIEALERAEATPAELLPELRALVHAAERWAARERDPGAAAAAARCRQALEAERPLRPAASTRTQPSLSEG
jgi:hypothetical protein